MRALLTTACGLAFAGSVCALPAFAHHGFAAEFDCSSPVGLKGVVRTVEWVNPHVWTYITVSEAGKPDQDWMIYGGTPNAMAREGLTQQTLKAGMEVSIKGYRAKDKTCPISALTHTNTCKVAGNALTLADGRTVPFVGTKASPNAGISNANPVVPAQCPAPKDE